jgi:acyl-CoA hydrolase
VREAFHRGGCDLVPNNFSDVPRPMRAATACSLVLAAVSPPDRHGFFSLGCHAEYVAPLVGTAPFFVEVNHRMPRTFGENQVHVSQVVGWCEADYPLAGLPHPPPRETDRRIAQHVAERIRDGATLQAGVGSVPNEILKLLGDHRDLGIHTELLADGFVDLVERGVVTGTRKTAQANTIVTTPAMGSSRLYRFVDENPGVEFWPVDYTNDPRNISRQERMVAINATLEVDFLGQCASESLGSEYWSSTGGQEDFGRRRDPFVGRPVVHRPALDHRGRLGVADRAAAAPRRGGDHVQERGRPRGYRTWGGRAAGAQHPRAGAAADRRRRARLPRGARAGGPPDRLPLGRLGVEPAGSAAA